MPKRSGPKSAAQTPAPAKERIFGSAKNPKGSAASEASAKSIRLSPAVMSSLKKKLAEFRKENPGKTNITIDDLKSVYRRGAGAYSVSHRPTITGGVPNTRNAWAMARVNKFLKKASGESVKKAYVQDDDLMRRGGQTEDINTGKEVINNMEVDGFAKGGELTDERKKEVREKWVKLVNMSPSELKRFYDSEEGKEAGLSPSEAKSQGIDSGRESARWILRMKETPVKDWTPEMWRWAGKQINFINRMSGNKGPLYKDGEKTRKHTSLLIWGHNPNKKAAGDLIETKSNSYMTGVQYNELPSVKTVERGQQIVLKDTVMTKQYGLHTLYYLVEVVSKSTMSGFYVLRVIKNLSHPATNAGRIITRSADNILTYGREVQKGVSEAIGLKRGGELNPDDTKVKKYFSHNSGAAGGVLVGKRHSEGGIKGINKSTGQPLEVEGGEVVITRDAVSDTTKREFMGKQMTNREILSQINQSGGGVAFADGGETGDISCRCSGREYSYGGKTMKDRDILSEMNALYKGMAIEDKEHGDTFKMLESGKLKYKDFLKRLVSDHLKENPNYYDKYKG